MDLADATLDEIRRALAPAIAQGAAFDGWSDATVTDAAMQAGVDPAVAAYAFSGGALEMIAAWIDTIDEAMAAALPAAALAGLPVRERITRLVRFRLQAVSGMEESLRRALAVMAQPRQAKAALARGWHSADLMWRLAGDESSDYNHYTRRAILAAIYAATLAVFVDDQSEAKADTLAFLDRRIAGVIRFEKAKARLIPAAGQHFSLTRFLGRLRYPAQ